MSQSGIQHGYIFFRDDRDEAFHCRIARFGDFDQRVSGRSFKEISAGRSAGQGFCRAVGVGLVQLFLLPA